MGGRMPDSDDIGIGVDGRRGRTMLLSALSVAAKRSVDGRCGIPREVLAVSPGRGDQGMDRDVRWMGRAGA
jgi:hypothetical protein